MSEYVIVAKGLDGYKIIFTTDITSDPRNPGDRARMESVKIYKIKEGYGQEFRDRMYGYLFSYLTPGRAFSCEIDEIDKYSEINRTFFKEFRKIDVFDEKSS